MDRPEERSRFDNITHFAPIDPQEVVAAGIFGHASSTATLSAWWPGGRRRGGSAKDDSNDQYQ